MKALELHVGSGRILSARRALMCLVAGAVAGLLTSALWIFELGPVVAWCVAASSALAWVWVIGWHQDAEGTKGLAEAERRSHSTDLSVVLPWLVSPPSRRLSSVPEEPTPSRSQLCC